MDEFGPQTRAIGKVFSLAFRAYLERPNPSPYATWASVLVLTAHGFRIRLEVESVWASTLAGAPLVVS